MLRKKLTQVEKPLSHDEQSLDELEANRRLKNVMTFRKKNDRRHWALYHTRIRSDSTPLIWRFEGRCKTNFFVAKVRDLGKIRLLVCGIFKRTALYSSEREF